MTFVGGGGQLPASAAEGFFTISGLLVGYLYGPRVLKDTKKVFYKIWRRAGLLYVLAVFFTFFYTAWAVLEPNSAKYATLYSEGGVKFLYNTLLLRYAFGWADFLTRYAMFMLFAPFVVLLIARGKAWLVAIASVGIWFFLRDNVYLLPFSAWQLDFMLGIILGYYLPQIEAWFKHLAYDRQRLIFRGVTMVAFVTFVCSIIFFVALHVFVPASSPVYVIPHTIASYTDKQHLAPVRVAIGIVWFAALYMVFRYYEKDIARKTFGILEVFGRNSLFVYCLHAFILFVIDLYLLPPISSILINTVVTLAVLVIIYVVTYYRTNITAYGKRMFANRSTTQVP